METKKKKQQRRSSSSYLAQYVWQLQLADAEEVLKGIKQEPGVRYPVLTPNLRVSSTPPPFSFFPLRNLRVVCYLLLVESRRRCGYGLCMLNHESSAFYRGSRLPSQPARRKSRSSRPRLNPSPGPTSTAPSRRALLGTAASQRLPRNTG